VVVQHWVKSGDVAKQAEVSLHHRRNWSTARLSTYIVVGNMISKADAEYLSLTPHLKGINLPFQILVHHPEEQECTPERRNFVNE